MTIKSRLQGDMKDALRAGEKDRLAVIRMAISEIKRIEIDTRKELDESGELAVIEKMVKQRAEAAEQYDKGKRPELADKERAEIETLRTYLPEPLSDAECDALIDSIIAATGASGVRDMGKVMGQLKQQAAGRVDMKVAGARVRSRLGA